MSSFYESSSDHSTTTHPQEEGKLSRRDFLRNWSTSVQSKYEQKSPDMIEQIKRSAEIHSKAKKSASRATYMERTNIFSTASSALALGSFKQTRSAPTTLWVPFGVEAPPVPSFQSIHEQYESRQRIISPIADNEEEVLVREEQLNEIQGEMMANFRVNASDANAFEQILSELQVLLKELEVEPDNDDEVSAKFGLYETFYKTIETLREQIMEFWKDSEELFTGGSREVALKKIKSIDSEQAMGIDDNHRHWFVYSMTKKVSENSAAIQRVLADLRTRLEILSDEDCSCPFCLEVIPKGKDVTLGCCHKSCTDCWNCWVEIKGNAAFCPLCKHNEFLASIYEVNSSTDST